MAAVSYGGYFALKFRLDRIYNFGDSANFRLWYFALKLHIYAHFRGLGHISSKGRHPINATPKRTILAQKHVI